MGDWLDAGGTGSNVDVAAMLDSRAADLVSTAVQSGALVSIGLTSDGGALGVTVTVDGRWRREYHRDTESLVDWLAGGMPDIIAACEQRLASSAPRKRERSPRGR